MISALAPWVVCLSLTTHSGTDPISGVWKGTLIGQGQFFPELGVPASFWLTHDGERVTGSMAFQGFEVGELDGTFDEASGKLTIAGTADSAAVSADLMVAGAELEGELSGLGLSFPVRAHRIATEVLEAPPSSPPPSNLDALSADSWRSDLSWLARYLPQVHANAFHTTSQEEWLAAVDELDARLSELNGQATAIAFAQLVARVGDAHTEIHWREVPGFPEVPVQFEHFADGLFVSAVHARWEAILGAEVLQIGRRSAERALKEVATVFAAENDSWRIKKALGNLPSPKLLSILDVSALDGAVPLIVETPAGEELEVLIEPVDSSDWRQLPDPANARNVRRGRGDRFYWFESVEGASPPTVYWAYNTCAENPAEPIDGFLDGLFRAYDRSQAERLVLDLRNNSGGNSAVLSQRMPRLFEHCGPDAIAVLIGPTTYSSGMMNAHQLREHGATLFGEPTGGKPNSYGELRSFRLPASGLRVFYSTKYFRMLADDPPSVAPDVLIRPRAAAFFAGDDPVLEAALAAGQ